jgi:hypothetical protein
VGERNIYFQTNNDKVGDRIYFNDLLRTIQPEEQEDYNIEFMGVLLHYLRTQVNIEGWNAQDLIIAIHCNTSADFNESLEGEYGDLNKVD